MTPPLTHNRVVTADARTTDPCDFFAAVTGRPRKTQEQRLVEHREKIERYIALIEQGGGWSIPPAYRAECERIIAEREAAECGPDPLVHLEPKRSAA